MSKVSVSSAKYQREWRKRNPGKAVEYVMRYRAKYPERYAESHKAAVRRYQERHRTGNPVGRPRVFSDEERKQRRRDYDKRHYLNNREKILSWHVEHYKRKKEQSSVFV